MFRYFYMACLILIGIGIHLHKVLYDRWIIAYVIQPIYT